MKTLLLVTSLLVVPALISGQSSQSGGLDPAEIMKPLADQWTSYSGDLSGKRFSALKLVNTTTVKNLSLKWVTNLTTGCGPAGTPPAGAAGGFGGGRGGGRGGGGGTAAPIVVGGLGNGDARTWSSAFRCPRFAPGVVPCLRAHSEQGNDHARVHGCSARHTRLRHVAEYASSVSSPPPR